MTTIPYAKVGRGGAIDGRDGKRLLLDGLPIPICDVQVIDPATGITPVDESSLRLDFIEIDAEAGFGLAVDNSKPWLGEEVPTKRVERPLELRVQRT